MWDKFIKVDGKVDGKLEHIAIWGVIILGGSLLINMLGGLMLPVGVVAAIYCGVKTYEADVRINGGDNG